MDSTFTADRLGNPNSAFVAGTENFCLDSIKSRGVMKVLNPSQTGYYKHFFVL